MPGGGAAVKLAFFAELGEDAPSEPNDVVSGVWRDVDHDDGGPAS
jgi:hypothetical protein